MKSPARARRWLLCSLLFSAPWLASGQELLPEGQEFSVSGPAPGDQVAPRAALGPAGGYVVWEDNAIDGSGSGIAARRVEANFSAVYGAFRVNQQTSGHQQRPQAALLKKGQTAIVWQGGKAGLQNICLRVLATNGAFATPDDVRINAYARSQQSAPVIAALDTGNAVVAWSSLYQDGDLEGVYARIVRPDGTFPTNTAFRVNQYTSGNQRNPAVAKLTNGNFVAVWVSENQGVSTILQGMGVSRADIYGRVFDATGQALGSEFRINTGNNFCADPDVCGAADGGLTVAWAQRDARSTDNWDIYLRQLGPTGASTNAVVRVNTFTYGDQFKPKISCLGQNQFVVWTSMGQDGSGEGVFGRTLNHGDFSSEEFQVNTTSVSRQMGPAIATDGGTRFLVLWACYLGQSSFDVLAQRWSADGPPIPDPAAPFVSALSQSRLSVAWPALAGFPLSHYELYIDGATTPVLVTDLPYLASGFAPGATHTFALAYVLASGHSSRKSPPGSGTTWGEDLYGKNGAPDGLPDDWQALYWGYKPSSWGAPNEDSDGDGATNWQEFLAGTNPMDPRSVLRMQWVRAPQGRRLQWNTVPGLIYQVQLGANFTDWVDYGAARLAAGTTDSLAVTELGRMAFYRIIRLR
jgi:hypothetical protein